MLVSELIAQLQALQAEHGDLEVQTVIPEGPYTRVEGEPAVLCIGYCDEEGEFVGADEREERVDDALQDAEENGDEVTDEEIRAMYRGPFICIGATSDSV